MKYVLMLAALLFVSAPAFAQTPIILGPSSVLAWDVPGAPSAAFALTLTYNLTTDGGTPTVLANVACAAPVAPATAPICSVLASTLPLGSHSLTMTDSTSGVTSLPSTPFAHVVIAIPIPANIRFK